MKESYTEIKSAYLEIKEWLEPEAFKVVTAQDRISQDLSFLGDDADELIHDFVEKFEIDFSAYDFYEYFYDECEIVNPLMDISGLLRLPFYILYRPVKLIYTKIHIPILEQSLLYYKRKDLTVGDLICSKLKGEFCLRANVNLQVV